MNEEGKLVKADIVPKFEISLNESKKRLEEMNQFIKEQMIDKTDYGTIAGIGKPTLFKSGAEKLENIFGFYHEFEQLDKTEDFEKGFVFYRYKCSVFHKKTGIKQSECVGSCNNKEKARIGQDVYTIVNTIDKMAQKRAFVGAILSASRLSNKFTQDVEDIDVKKNDSVTKCEGCGASLSDTVKEFSMKKFKKPLCYACQKKEKGATPEEEEVVM